MVSVPKELNAIIEKIKKNEVLEENRHKEVTDILSETSRLREENARLSDLLLEKDMEKEELRVNLAVKNEEAKFQELEKKLVAEARLKWIKMNDDYESQLDKESHERWEQRRSYVASLQAETEKIKSEEVDVEDLERFKLLLAGTINKVQPAAEKTAEIEEEFIDFDMIEQLNSLETYKLNSSASNSYNFSTPKENNDESQNSTPKQNEPKSKFQNISHQFNIQNSNPRNRRLNFESNENTYQNKSNFSATNQPLAKKPRVQTNFNKSQFSSKQNNVQQDLNFDYNDDDFEYLDNDDDCYMVEEPKIQYNQNSYSQQTQKSQFVPKKTQITQKSNSVQKSQFVPLNRQSQSFLGTSLNQKSNFTPKNNQITKPNSYSNFSQNKSKFTSNNQNQFETQNLQSNPSQKSQFTSVKTQNYDEQPNMYQKSNFMSKHSQNIGQKSNIEYNDEFSEANYKTETSKSSQINQKSKYEFTTAKTYYNNSYENYDSKNQKDTSFDSKKSTFVPKNPSTIKNNFTPIRKEGTTASAVSLKTPVPAYTSGFQFKVASTAASFKQPVIPSASAGSKSASQLPWLRQHNLEDMEVEEASTNQQTASYENCNYDNFNHSSHSPFRQTSQQETDFTQQSSQVAKKSKFTPKKSTFNQQN